MSAGWPWPPAQALDRAASSWKVFGVELQRCADGARDAAPVIAKWDTRAARHAEIDDAAAILRADIKRDCETLRRSTAQRFRWTLHQLARHKSARL